MGAHTGPSRVSRYIAAPLPPPPILMHAPGGWATRRRCAAHTGKCRFWKARSWGGRQAPSSGQGRRGFAVAQGRQPAPLPHALAHMGAMRFRLSGGVALVPGGVAELAGCDDVVASVRAAFTAWLKVFRSASKGLCASRAWHSAQLCLPHRKVAIVTAPTLKGHFGATQARDIAHGNHAPFNFVRSECATP